MGSIDRTALLCFFAGTNALALFLVWLFVPGTERQIATMEEMNYVFGVTTREHVNYQITKVAPWCYEHYVRRREVSPLAPLYRWAGDREYLDSGTNEATQNATAGQNGSPNVGGQSGTA
ncbi:MAG: hypothetical protein Q9226_004474 [Calogaya cf. arnoldii]